MRTHDIDKDTPLVPEIIADMVTTRRDVADALCLKARANWMSQAAFRESFKGKDERDVLREWFERWTVECPELAPTTVLTVIVREVTSPFPPCYPHPLIYDLEFDHEFTAGDGIFGVAEVYKDEILRRVAEERVNEIAGARQNTSEEETAVRGIMRGLELIFAFVGPAEICMDWRTD